MSNVMKVIEATKLRLFDTYVWKVFHQSWIHQFTYSKTKWVIEKLQFNSIDVLYMGDGVNRKRMNILSDANTQNKNQYDDKKSLFQSNWS